MALSEPINFKPQEYGLTPQASCTACWNGYWCEYHIYNGLLLLKNLFMFNSEGNYPPLNGVGVIEQTYHEVLRLGPGHKKEKIMMEDHMGHREYRNVDLPIKYTGKILVGDGFIQEYYIHMGYQRAWAYEELLEFVFEDGRLVKTNDHSDMAKKMRVEIEAGNNKLDMKDKAWWIKS